MVRYIKEKGMCTTAIIAELLNVKDRRARAILGELVKKDVLKKQEVREIPFIKQGNVFLTRSRTDEP